jgi:hypothetical protein
MTMSRCRSLGRITSQGWDSAEGGRAAAARPRNGGVYAHESRLRNEPRRGANQKGDIERVTESRGAGLRKRRAQRAQSICHAARIDSQARLTGRREMTEIVIDSTLLCRQQQQQKTQCFVHVSHSVKYGRRIRLQAGTLTELDVLCSFCGAGTTTRAPLCFSYALAKSTGEPLLFKGRDFAKTDLLAA